MKRNIFTAVILLVVMMLTSCSQGSDWKSLEKELTSDEVTLLDVRTSGEYTSGHIPGALLTPFDTIDTQTPGLPLDTPIVVYCRSGNRSSQAARTLTSLGYTNVRDFGSVSNWKGPLVQGSSAN